MTVNRILRSRIFAAALTVMLSLSLIVPSFGEAFAEEAEDEGLRTEQTAAEEAADELPAEMPAEEGEISDAAEADDMTDAEGAAEADEASAEETGAEGSEEAGSDMPDVPDAEAENQADSVTPEGSDAAAEEPAEAGSAEEASKAVLSAQEAGAAAISVKASGDEKYITAVWSKVETAQYYLVYYDNNTSATKVGPSAERRIVFSNADASKAHTVKVRAYRARTAEEKAAAPTAGDILIAEGSAVDIRALLRSKLKKFTTKAVNQNLSLRKLIGEGYNGYAVAQGAATDGVYAYYMLASSATQKGRVLKIRLSDNAVVMKGPVIGIHHGNGMTYDSKRKKLVAVGYGSHRHYLSFIDPETLTLSYQKKVKYPYEISGISEAAYDNGLAAIAYVAKYNVYLARSRGRNNGHGDRKANNDLWVINASNLKAIGHIFTRVTAKYPNTYQSMDADEKYVYYLLSPGSGQKKNVILALDWNSEKLLPVLNGDAEYVSKMWYCNNDGSGEPDAAITIPIKHESEGLFHTTDASGKAHFYVSEYHGRWSYKMVTKKKKYKVKWKKVTKKVKWKKVKIKKGKKKGKYKLKYKKKKVWKYKTKTKKYKKKVRDKWKRDNYVYDLGII